MGKRGGGSRGVGSSGKYGGSRVGIRGSIKGGKKGRMVKGKE